MLAELGDAIARLHVAIAELAAELAAAIVPMSCHDHQNQPCGKSVKILRENEQEFLSSKKVLRLERNERRSSWKST